MRLFSPFERNPTIHGNPRTQAVVRDPAFRYFPFSSSLDCVGCKTKKKKCEYLKSLFFFFYVFFLGRLGNKTVSLPPPPPNLTTLLLLQGQKKTNKKKHDLRTKEKAKKKSSLSQFFQLPRLCLRRELYAVRQQCPSFLPCGLYLKLSAYFQGGLLTGPPNSCLRQLLLVFVLFSLLFFLKE